MRARALPGLVMALLLLVLGVAGPGCGLPPPEEDCDNGEDDDGDGLVDGDDPSCAGCSARVSDESSFEVVNGCGNGADDDCDGLADCDDPDCAGSCPASEVCDNDADDDLDGLVDCDDDDCDCEPSVTVDPLTIEATHVVGSTECPQDLGSLDFAPLGVITVVTSLPPGLAIVANGRRLEAGDSFETGDEVRVLFECEPTGVDGDILLAVLDGEGRQTNILRVHVTVTVESPPAGPRTYPTITGPEGITIVVPDAATFAPAGLVTGRPYAVVTSTEGGADLVDLETGERDTAPWLSPAYGVLAYRDDITTDPEMFVFYGPTNVGYTYWDPSGTFGFTSLSSGSNVTDHDIGPLDATGVPTADAFVHNGGPFVQVTPAGSSSAVILGDSFPGGAYPASPVSVALTPDGTAVLLVLENGELWFGAPGSTLAPAGTTGADMRLIECARTGDLRICAAADHGGDAVHLVEVANDGASVIGSLPGGDGPVEPAVIVDGARVLVASTGSNDGSLSLLRYDPATGLFESLGSEPISGCAEPAHSRFLAPNDLVVSCHGSASLQRFDPFVLVGATR